MITKEQEMRGESCDCVLIWMGAFMLVCVCVHSCLSFSHFFSTCFLKIHFILRIRMGGHTVAARAHTLAASVRSALGLPASIYLKRLLGLLRSYTLS